MYFVFMAVFACEDIINKCGTLCAKSALAIFA
jgi:hypothetical protein